MLLEGKFPDSLKSGAKWASLFSASFESKVDYHVLSRQGFPQRHKTPVWLKGFLQSRRRGLDHAERRGSLHQERHASKISVLICMCKRSQYKKPEAFEVLRTGAKIFFECVDNRSVKPGPNCGSLLATHLICRYWGCYRGFHSQVSPKASLSKASAPPPTA